MRLLITTQAVDLDDAVLGFFHGWIARLAREYESVHVICLKEGRHELPENVTVHSLGKQNSLQFTVYSLQKTALRIKYVFKFLRLIVSLRKEYDSAYVHMNQEYVLLGGFVWKLLGKSVYMWRNHHAGSFRTDLAAKFCTKVFCTSRFSYTAKFKKTVLMPVGIDTDKFVPGTSRTPRSILFLARIAPSKRPEMLIKSLAKLKEKGIEFSASIYGSALPSDQRYLEGLKDLTGRSGLVRRVHWHQGVPHFLAPQVFSSHDIFVNLSRSGMYDKTIFEAAASGALVLASSRDFAAIAQPRFVFEEDSVDDLAAKLESLLSLQEHEREAAAQSLMVLAQKNSLEELVKRLAEEMQD